MTSLHDSDALAPEHLASLRADYESESRYRLMQNAVTAQGVDTVALDRTIVTDATHTFSTSLDDWTPTDQGASGRCWLFSGLNLCRVDTMKEMNAKAFEFSQSYLMFWDKVERANFVLGDKPRRWRVENSYGSSVGDKGFFLMNDSWYDEYMFEIAAPRSYLWPELRAALDTEPITLPPWDPMGALAGRNCSHV